MLAGFCVGWGLGRCGYGQIVIVGRRVAVLVFLSLLLQVFFYNWLSLARHAKEDNVLRATDYSLRFIKAVCVKSKEQIKGIDYVLVVLQC